MKAKSVKSILIVFLFTGLLFLILCMLGCVSAIPLIQKMAQPNPNEDPVKLFNIKIAPKQHEQFFTQLRSFSKKHSLKLDISLFDADNITFLASMYGDNFHITAVTVSSSPEEINVFFHNDGATPTLQKKVDNLMDELKNLSAQIPNVIIQDEKPFYIAMEKQGLEKEVSKALFARLQQFADKNSLKLQKIDKPSYKEETSTFWADLAGDTFRISCNNRPSATNQMDVIFYIEFDGNKPTPNAQKIVNDLLQDMKDFFKEYPGVTFKTQF